MKLFQDKKFLFLFTAVIFAVTLEILSIAGIEIPMPYAPFIYGVLVVGVGYDVLWGGLKSLARLKLGSINLLMLIAVGAAFYLGEYSEAAVVIVLYSLGEKMEDIGIETSMSALDRLISNTPKMALLKASGLTVPVEEVEIGSIVLVKPHDAIPLDGVVVAGATAVDESTITGESLPAEKHEGDAVFAGTLNKNGFIEIKSTRAAKDTTFAQIVALTGEAQQNKSEAQKFIQRFAAIYTPVVILLAAGLFTIPVFLLGQDLSHWLNQSISLLVIACPCALVISTPVAIYAAMGNASSKGLLIKGGKYLEAFAAVKMIAMDKTRTITCGQPAVSDVVPLNDSTLEELLACCAGIEIFSEHPLAQSIVDYSVKNGFEPHIVSNFKSMVGNGACADCITCGKKPAFVGKPDFIAQRQPIDDATQRIIDRFSEEGKTCVLVCCDHEIKGLIALTDEVKADSREAIARLRDLGIESVMLTGDSPQAAQYTASQAGIQHIFASLLPQDKAKTMNDLLAQHRAVAMVGDGVNDAPALAAATVGIAMGTAGSDAAIEVANIALMNDKLSLLPYLARLSRRTVATIRGNTVGAIVVKLLFIALAFAGYSNLVMAIAADVGVMLAVVLISLRLTAFR